MITKQTERASAAIVNANKDALKTRAALEKAMLHACDYRDARGTKSPKNFKQLRDQLDKAWTIVSSWLDSERRNMAKLNSVATNCDGVAS